MFFLSSLLNPYIAIIGDLKHSQQVENRGEMQKKLQDTLSRINRLYAEDIAAKFTITLGDEFQGLLSAGKSVLDILLDIEREMYPQQIRFGIGIGEITTEINPEIAIGADGPAYYMARKAIDFLKESESKNQVSRSYIRIEQEGEPHATVLLINTMLSLLTTLRDSWTDRQREVIWDLLVHKDSQSEAALRLDISQSSVQKNLTGGNYYAYAETRATIKSALSEIIHKEKGDEI